jgi:sec-independent protein translocase protein TatA
MFGIGGGEFVLILMLVLIVAGPKRMIQWAYQLGVYTAKLRQMWTTTMVQLQREVNASGVKLDLPKELPTSRQELARQVLNLTQSVTEPLNETAKELNQEFKKPISRPAAQQNGTPPSNGQSSETKPNDDAPYGTWSNTGQS